MRRLFLMCLAAILLMAGVVTAHTQWSVKDPNGVKYGFSKWNWKSGTLTNWTEGIPPGDTPGTDKTQFLIAAQPECILDYAAGNIYDIAVDKGVSPGDGGLTIAKGGSVSCNALISTWNGIGYAAPGRLNIERGGSINLFHRTMLGRTGPAKSLLNMNGGTLTNTNRMQLNSEAAAVGGIITMNAGLMSLGNSNGGLDWNGVNNGSKSQVNIKFGTILITGDVRTSIQSAITAGGLYAFNRAGTVVYDYNVRNAGKTTITATGDPMERYPTYDQNVYVNTALPLSWKNQTGSTGVDVWFGKDPTWIPEPNALLPGYPGHYVDFNKVVSNQNVTTVNVDASINLQEYAWRINTYGPVAEPNGLILYFKALSDAPPTSVVIDTPSMVTWINTPIHLSATVTDDNKSTPTIVWSSPDEPNAVFTNKVYTYNAGTGKGTATADVAVNWHTAQFTVKITVSDASPLGGSVSATKQHDCAESACQATRVLGLGVAYGGDVDANCIINIADMQRLALDWLKDYTLLAPSPIAP
jgi:hypothetical protein